MPCHEVIIAPKLSSIDPEEGPEPKELFLAGAEPKELTFLAGAEPKELFLEVFIPKPCYDFMGDAPEIT